MHVWALGLSCEAPAVGPNLEKGWAPKGGAPLGRRPKISRFFSLSCRKFQSFFGLLVEFWWCLGRLNVHVLALWLSCETPETPRTSISGQMRSTL